jgi:uncharacterized OsmC-like protein
MAMQQKTVNGIDPGVLQETMGAIEGDPELGRCVLRARNHWLDGGHSRTTIEGFFAAKQEMSHKQVYELFADESPLLAGHDEAPSPGEHLLNALATCLTTTMVAHAALHGIDIAELDSEVEGEIDLRGYLGIDNAVPKGFTKIRITFHAKSDADTEKLKRLAEYSPVYNTLISGVNVDLQVEGPASGSAEPRDRPASA